MEARADGRLRCELVGDPAVVVAATAPLTVAGAAELSFFAHPRYRAQLEQSAAAVVVLRRRDGEAILGSRPPPPVRVYCDQPYAWFAFAAQVLAATAAFAPGIAGSASVHPDARIDPTARIDDFVVIAAGSIVEGGAWIGAGCSIGAGARIGAQTRLYPRVVVAADCTLGARGIVHSGAVIGADGFGFAPLDGRWIKIPQSGRVLIGDDVEIGANTTIDRGAMGDTSIEDGVKIDNQVQIGHNCTIGAHTAIAGCVGIAGSARIGRRCQLGGAAMISGHLTICDDAVVAGGTLIGASIERPGLYTGVFPSMPHRDWERNAALLRQLTDLRQRLRRLERRAGATDEEDR
ncbi:MAG: UDP-3-O-(3-hydroxymyristoyl)glucosamine N-acyltransferase [Betaproteobacteria bacterium]